MSQPAAYSYLGPAGTFTEAALAQVDAARGAPWRPVNNIGEALDDVTSGESVAAMLAIENTVEGGVAAVLDALASIPDLRIVGEYLVPVRFALLVPPGTRRADVRTIAASLSVAASQIVRGDGGHRVAQPLGYGVNKHVGQRNRGIGILLRIMIIILVTNFM